MLRAALAMSALLAGAAPVHGQGLRAQLTRLFTFGQCGEPLCLDVGNEHGRHFIPQVAQGSDNLIAFLGDAVGSSVSRVPLGAASSGVSFVFRGGVPVRQQVSAGPIFAERARTVGRGRLFLGASLTRFRYRTLRGTPLDELVFNFRHQNVGPEAFGNPAFENDVIRVWADMDVSMTAAMMFASYGLLDRLDIGVALPLVRTSIRGVSTAHVVPFGRTVHEFGPAGRGDLAATASVDGSAVGIGDITVRAKATLPHSGRLGIGFVADARLPTGSETELLGAGGLTFRGLGILSARYGDFSPHLNAGYARRTSEFQTDAVLLTLGFDHLLAPRATLALDLVSEWQVGEGKLILPEPIRFDVPYQRVLPSTSIQDEADDVVYASIGTKLATSRDLTVVLNALLPVVDGGLQPSAAWTVGLEYTFAPPLGALTTRP